MAAFAAALATATAALLASQAIAKGRHPILTEPTVGAVLPWAGAVLVAVLPIALGVGLVGGFLRRSRWGMVLGVLVLAVAFHLLRESASEARSSALADYPSKAEVEATIRAAASNPGDRANILLITIDTLRWDHLGFAGYRRPVSPRLDELARRGTVFRHGIAQAPETKSSMASMMTGLYPHVVEHERAQREAGAFVGDGFHLLAERLSAAGYQTAAFVSNPYLKAGNGFAQGFFTYDDETGLYLGSGEARKRDAADVVDPAIAWLAARDVGRPFFLWVHILDPHHPYEPAEPGPWEDTDSPTFRAFATEYDALSVGEMTTHLQALADGEVELRPGELEYLIGRYDAEILQTDRQIGRLFDQLEAHGAGLEATLILVTADHGEEFFDHGGLLHSHTLYDELIRVPFVVAGPGFDTAETRDLQARLLDIAPTVLTAANLPTDGLDGEPLQASSRRHRPALAFRGLTEVSLRTPKLKLHAKYGGHHNLLCRRGDPFADVHQLFVARYGRGAVKPGPAPRLFDLDRDPAEAKALADASESQRLQCQLAQLLAEHPPRAIEEAGAAEGLSPADVERLRALGYIN